MSRKYKVDELLAQLNDEEVAEYQAILRQPAATIDDLMAWFGEKGCQVSRGAVWHHRRKFEEQTESLRRSAEMARAFVDVAKTESVESISDAALFRMSQVLMEQSMLLDAEEALNPKDLVNMTKAIRNLIGGKREVEELKRQLRESMDEAERAARKGASADEVISRVRGILGLPQKGGGK